MVDSPVILTSDANEQKNCDQLLNEVIEGGIQSDWIHRFDEIYQVLKTLNQKCTNMDFKSPK